MSTEYAVENGWLVEVINEHTCGAGVGSMPHEPGCGMVHVARIEDLLAAAHPAPAEPSECEDGVFGSQDIANALGGRGPDDATESSDGRLSEEEAQLLLDCWREAGPMEVSPVVILAAVERILAARQPEGRGCGCRWERDTDGRQTFRECSEHYVDRLSRASKERDQ